MSAQLTGTGHTPLTAPADAALEIRPGAMDVVDVMLDAGGVDMSLRCSDDTGRAVLASLISIGVDILGDTPNFRTFDIEVGSSYGEKVTITFSRADGETPAEVIGQLRSRIAELEDELVQLAGKPCSWTLVSYESGETFACVLGAGHTDTHYFADAVPAGGYRVVAP